MLFLLDHALLDRTRPCPMRFSSTLDLWTAPDLQAPENPRRGGGGWGFHSKDNPIHQAGFDSCMSFSCNLAIFRRPFKRGSMLDIHPLDVQQKAPRGRAFRETLMYAASALPLRRRQVGVVSKQGHTTGPGSAFRELIGRSFRPFASHWQFLVGFVCSEALTRSLSVFEFLSGWVPFSNDQPRREPQVHSCFGRYKSRGTITGKPTPHAIG